MRTIMHIIGWAVILSIGIVMAVPFVFVTVFASLVEMEMHKRREGDKFNS